MGAGAGASPHSMTKGPGNVFERRDPSVYFARLDILDLRQPEKRPERGQNCSNSR